MLEEKEFELKKIKEILNQILDNKKYVEDHKTINDILLCLTGNDLDNVDINQLEEYKNNILDLEIKYDDMFDLSYYFDPIYVEIKKNIHEKEVKQLRETIRNGRKEENMSIQKIKIVKFYEIEEALAKLLFHLKLSTLYKPYNDYKDIFEEMLKIVEVWIGYYAENENLLKMTDEEVIRIKELSEQIPFEAYNIGNYYEEIDTWLTSVIYYGSCPVNEEYDESLIKRKGEVKKNV